MSGFRSWVEDYVPPAAPLDREAFNFRKLQRMNAARAMTSQAAARRNAGPKVSCNSLLVAARHAASLAGDVAQAELRQRDPVLSAQIHLQRRGHVVHRAEVADGRRGYWHVDSLEITEEAMLDMASRKGWSAPRP